MHMYSGQPSQASTSQKRLYGFLPNRDIRVTGDTRERTPGRKTPMDSYSKLKTRTIKN